VRRATFNTTIATPYSGYLAAKAVAERDWWVGTPTTGQDELYAAWWAEYGAEEVTFAATVGAEQVVVRHGGKVITLSKKAVGNIMKIITKKTGKQASIDDVANVVVHNLDRIKGIDLPKGFDPSKGFDSFEAFKKANGVAGTGQAWHHIVEQTKNAANFAPELIHNPSNLITLPSGKDSIHAKISAYYSSKIPGLTGTLTVREWISKKSLREQFDFGIDVIKKFGGTQYLPPHLQ